MIVQYHPLAASDLHNAIVYYNQQRAGLGEEFRSEVYAAIERIRSNPFYFGIVEHDIRRCFVRRFPYGILFRIINDEILRVLVIRHHRRRAAFGLRRPIETEANSGQFHGTYSSTKGAGPNLNKTVEFAAGPRSMK